MKTVMMTIARSAALLLLSFQQCATAADFNGDGRQDLLWRTNAGNPRIWLMNGPAAATRNTLSPARGAEAAIVAGGNFFGPGSGAILWADSSGRLSLWRSNGATVQAACTIADAIDPGWTLLGVGDLDGDGIDDVLGRLPGGVVQGYLIDGCNPASGLLLGATAQPAWTFAGIGPVDSHSPGAIFWRDAGGNVVLWRLHNNASVLSTTLPAGAFAAWTIAAIADFDGDGLVDILWRDPGGTATALWLMSGSKDLPATVAAVSTHVFAAPDTVFDADFDSGVGHAPALSVDWSILGASDLDGDGRADVILANEGGDVATWRMDGAAIEASGIIPAEAGMPYSQHTGWRMPLDRPTVSKLDDQVTISWPALAGTPHYQVYASAAHDPAATGVTIAAASPTLVFGRNDAGFADKRQFAVAAEYLGVQLPPSAEAYLVEFSHARLPAYGPMAVADINRDGCIEILGLLGDCHGNFQAFGESAMGLGALRAPGRADRDLRFADLDGDGIDDLVSNVYSTLDDSASQVLFYRGIGNAQFVEDSAFTALGIRGFGETIVIADFNNDGFLDVFLPHYSFNRPQEHSWLLVNDGGGHFADLADAAGVALRGVPACARPEGAQAADINGDGWIDLYAASHLFLNAGAAEGGTPQFQDLGPVIDAACDVITESSAGLPQFFDEGAKFIDLDNSGQLSLALNSERTPPGLRILKFDGVAHFSDVSDVADVFFWDAWGFNAADVDGDGRSDLVVGGGCDVAFFQGGQINPQCSGGVNPHALPQLLVNRAGRFEPHDFYDDGLDPIERGWNDLITWGDFDDSGTVDFFTRTAGGSNGGFTLLTNQASSADRLIVRVLGADGAANQAGRVVRVSPLMRPGVIMTQVVDGGSGYMANSPYDLAFATPYPGEYTVTVRFAHATYTTTAHAGERLSLFADGSVSRP
jgi:hypothetical protein